MMIFLLSGIWAPPASNSNLPPARNSPSLECCRSNFVSESLSLCIQSNIHGVEACAGWTGEYLCNSHFRRHALCFNPGGQPRQFISNVKPPLGSESEHKSSESQLIMLSKILKPRDSKGNCKSNWRSETCLRSQTNVSFHMAPKKNSFPCKPDWKSSRRRPPGSQKWMSCQQPFSGPKIHVLGLSEWVGSQQSYAL